MKQIVNKLKSRLSTKLPVGMAEFDAWSESIINTYGFPNNDSIRFALATMILHSKEDMAYAPKHYFAMRLIKGMSNQVAGGVMQDLKTKQQEQMKAELEAQKQAEATSPSSAAASCETAE